MIMPKLEDVLDECLDRLTHGEATLEECIASHPEHADELRHLLAVVGQLERGQNIRPTAAFKSQLRARVMAHARIHPPSRTAGWWHNISSLRLAFNRAFQFAFGAAAIILLFLLTGTVLAQRALPGEALYPWKRFSEQVLRALHPDPLRADLRVAERRTEDLIRVAGTPQAEALAVQGYQETLAELSHYTNAQDQQRISETLLEQKADLEQAQLTVPALDQLLSDVEAHQTHLQLDYTAEMGKEGRLTYRVSITNNGPTTPVTATLVHTFSPSETLVSAGEASCTRPDEGTLNCIVPNISTSMPRNLSLITAVDPCFSGIITHTATVTGTVNVINVNQNNQIAARTAVTLPYPGYTQVAYVQSSGGRTHDLGMVTAEETSPLHLRAAAPAWSPDGTQIAFFGQEGISELGPDYSQGNGVWVMDVTNTEAQSPRQLVAQDHIKNMAWSPDGTKLAFEVRPPGISAHIVVVDAKGGRQISRFPGGQPAWNPDSQKLAIRTCAPDCGLWQVNFDGSNLEQITADSSDSYPSWSPTGQYLAFASQQRDGNWEIYRLRLADNQVMRLTHRAATDTTPVFGPCGQDIYLRTDHYGSWWVTVMRLAGSDERQVKEGVGPSDEWGLTRPAIR